ncbi:hypothetical protein ABZ770_41310 [Streptomyces sp. NPDC006654]|uniref:hypothetical protein n=1 Tax=Streptomyces sp. NPDC006654 TaxID=3156897 RepID=UPI0033E942B6
MSRCVLPTPTAPTADEELGDPDPGEPRQHALSFGPATAPFSELSANNRLLPTTDDEPIEVH